MSRCAAPCEQLFVECISVWRRLLFRLRPSRNRGAPETMAGIKKAARKPLGVVTLSQTERNLPTTANVDARNFKDLARWLIVQIGRIKQAPQYAR